MAAQNQAAANKPQLTIDSSHAVSFFDIDGTLVWRDFEALANGGSADGVMGSFGAAPTPAVYGAFDRMTARGHASFICTGRPLCMIYPSLRELNATGIVACAGAYAAIGSTVVRDEHIAPEFISRVLKLFSAAGANVLLESNEHSIELCPAGSEARFPGSDATESAASIEEMAQSSPFAKFCAWVCRPAQWTGSAPSLSPISPSVTCRVACTSFHSMGSIRARLLRWCWSIWDAVATCPTPLRLVIRKMTFLWQTRCKRLWPWEMLCPTFRPRRTTSPILQQTMVWLRALSTLVLSRRLSVNLYTSTKPIPKAWSPRSHRHGGPQLPCSLQQRRRHRHHECPRQCRRQSEHRSQHKWAPQHA